MKDVLDKPRLDKIRRGCEIAIREMVGRDPARSGNRGSHRYSFGTAPAHFGLQDYWATLKDPPAVVEIMEAVFGTKDSSAWRVVGTSTLLDPWSTSTCAATRCLPVLSLC